jgi:hypothetical protein
LKPTCVGIIVVQLKTVEATGFENIWRLFDDIQGEPNVVWFTVLAMDRLHNAIDCSHTHTCTSPSTTG